MKKSKYQLLKESWLTMLEDEIKENLLTIIPDFDKVKVYLVDGEKIENKVDTSYIGGSHHYYTNYIPEDEIWLDDELHSTNLKFILFHEYVERLLMKYLKYDYDTAHEIATNYEREYRAAPDTLSKILINYFDKYFKGKSIHLNFMIAPEISKSINAVTKPTGEATVS